VLFVVWDEGVTADTAAPHSRRGGGGHVVLIATGPGAARRARVSTPANHYALLHTIESRLGLPVLGHAKTAPTLSDLFAAAG
jgi:hypothetical protein